MKNITLKSGMCAGVVLAAFAMSSFPVSAAELNFPIETYDFSYHADGNVYLQLANADWSKRAQVIFTRGSLPADPIHYDSTYGMVR